MSRARCPRPATRQDRPWNVYEQGGILIGLRCRTPQRSEEFVVVRSALSIHSDSRSRTYVSFDHRAWSDLLDRFDRLKRGGRVEAKATIVGWYHTHPNWLDCYMRVTQRGIFHRLWNYAMVLNRRGSASPAVADPLRKPSPSASFMCTFYH